jgi:hypothetical protein
VSRYTIIDSLSYIAWNWIITTNTVFSLSNIESARQPSSNENFMEHNVAREITELMFKINGEINNSLFIVQQSSDEVSYGRYKAAVANIMGEILIEILNPIFKQYPDLIPDELK